MKKDIYIPNRLNYIKKTSFRFPNKVNVITCDTETVKGKPYTIQLYNNIYGFEDDKNPSIFFVDEHNILDVFCQYLKENVKSRYCNLVFFHNLSFDIPIIFYDELYKFADNEANFIWGKDCGFTIFSGKLWFGKAKIGKTDNIKILDTGNFFIKNSLDRLSKDLNLEHKKMPSPMGLGEKKLKDDYFIKYALNDVLVEYDLVKYILNFCKEFDIEIPISIANMAQKIFTNKFMTHRDIIRQPNYTANYYCIESFHGGKNRYYLDTVCKIKDVYVLDVKSMYPMAMINLPPFTNASIVKTHEFIEDKEGVYRIKGYVKKCKYPILCDSHFKYLSDTKFKDIYVTSYELKEGLQSGEIQLDESDLTGYLIYPSARSRNPLKDYIDYFYKLKNDTPKSDARYYMFKLLLNSLYGKFFENIRYDGDYEYTFEPRTKQVVENPQNFIAGGLFNPMIATLITGYTRAYMHRIEHRYNSLDTSTDSVKTIVKPFKEDLGEDIGKLAIESFGDCLFFRNKLYIQFSNKIKYAMHGFQLRNTKERPYKALEELLKMYLERKNDYSFERMVKVKESLVRQDLTPFTFQKFNKSLNVKYPSEFDKTKEKQELEDYAREHEEIEGDFDL